VNFSVSAECSGQLQPAPFQTSPTAIRTVFYPGGGVEAFIGWFGVRAEVGDLMYFQDGGTTCAGHVRTSIRF